ncbi:MAG: abortive infection family protein [Bacteroidetes bacterium]|nr:abortive infection family protein [Bacteroidota bacterium]
MSSFKGAEKLKFERLFGMSSGYVLDFSNRTFGDIILEITGINVYDEVNYGGSKANRLRTFWNHESDYNVSKLNSTLLEHWKTINENNINESDMKLYEDCLIIIEKFGQSSIEEHLEAIQPNFDEKDFSLLAKSIRDTIQQNEPEVALDRLHTFVVKYIRSLCDKHKITYDKDKPLHSFFGEYVTHLKEQRIVDSQMTERILKSSISILEAFNQVRNNQSFAHDNPILNYNESMLIFKNISSIINFIQAIEKPKFTIKEEDVKEESDDLPF